MPTFDEKNFYYSGQGVVMIGKRDPVTGNPIGLRRVGNVPDLKITIATTVIDHKGSQDGQRAIDARLQTETKATASVTLESWDRKNLAKALRGDYTDIPGGSVVAEAHLGFPGLVTGLKFISVSSVVAKLGGTTVLTPWSTAVVPGVTKWDYKLNPDAGSLLFNDGTQDGGYDHFTAPSPVDAGSAITVDYTYAAQKLVDSLTQPLTDNWLRFEGLNTLEENSPVVIDIFRFSNDPLKELALISDTFGQFMIEGAVLTDPTRPSGSKYFTAKKLD